MLTTSHVDHLTHSERTHLQDVVSSLLEQAKQQGASATEIDAYLAAGYCVNVRLGEVETVEYNRDKSLTITVYMGQAQGSASCTTLEPESLRQTLLAACEIAKVTQADPYAGLAEPELMAYQYPDLNLYHPWNLSVEQAIELAIDCETQALSHDKRIANSDGVSIATHEGFNIYGNSHGFIGHFPTTRHSINCVLIAQDAAGMQRDYSYTTARDPHELTSIKTLAKEAAEATVNRLQPRRLKTGKVPVIFAAEVARGVIGHFVSAITGSSLYRQSSFLLNHLEKSIFPEHIQIIEQPHLLKALGSSPFDNEGVRLYERELVKDGILKEYILSSYSARKLGMRTTGNAGGIHNLSLQPGEKNLQQLLKLMDRGLLVTEVMGQGVNIVTGDYSRGAVGFWVENGEIQYPVEEITIAGNLRDMFANLACVANDVDMRGSIRTGSLLIEQMTVAGE